MVCSRNLRISTGRFIAGHSLVAAAPVCRGRRSRSNSCHRRRLEGSCCAVSSSVGAFEVLLCLPFSGELAYEVFDAIDVAGKQITEGVGEGIYV